MKLLAAFLRLVRWPNLLFIALTQWLFYIAVIQPSLSAIGKLPTFYHPYLYWLILASVAIAAAGYIINDYFDLNIDQINKPQKNVVENIISRRWVILWHLLLSLLGIGISFYVGWLLRIWWLAPANLMCVVLLFFYSTTLKKKLLYGNILISVLTAWVILVLSLSEVKLLTSLSIAEATAYKKIFRIGMLYASFAFIISLIREVVKDMEDIEGDRKYGCYTMPIAWGLNVSKVFVAVWIIVLCASLTLIQLYVLQFGWWLSAFYCMVTIVAPSLYVLNLLFKAQHSKDFAKLSNWLKGIMLTGILSLIFFYFI